MESFWYDNYNPVGNYIEGAILGPPDLSSGGRYGQDFAE
jgi:hypothetical protein